jgi:hypothetical protein
VNLASRLTAFFVALISAGALTVVGASPAKALDAAGITCVGDQTATYAPGLTLEVRPTDFKVTGTLRNCVSLAHPEIVSGTFSGEGKGSFSCLAANAMLRTVITWNTGQSTTVDVGLTVNAKPAGSTVLVSAGEVRDGLFRGGVYVAPKVLPNPDPLACTTPAGMSSASGPIGVTIVLAS